jgi:surface antigen
MKLLRFGLTLFLVVTLAACARFENTRPVANSTTAAKTQTSTSQQVKLAPSAPSPQFAQEEILAFLPNEVLGQLSAKDKSEAASAQFFALQYGRVGAFREWNADSSIKGEVSVGPYVKVNNLDCREFSHTVIISKQRYTQSGTSCREADGQWNVVG